MPKLVRRHPTFFGLIGTVAVVAAALWWSATGPPLGGGAAGHGALCRGADRNGAGATSGRGQTRSNERRRVIRCLSLSS